MIRLLCNLWSSFMLFWITVLSLLLKPTLNSYTIQRFNVSLTFLKRNGTVKSWYGQVIWQSKKQQPTRRILWAAFDRSSRRDIILFNCVRALQNFMQRVNAKTQRLSSVLLKELKPQGAQASRTANPPLPPLFTSPISTKGGLFRPI